MKTYNRAESVQN